MTSIVSDYMTLKETVIKSYKREKQKNKEVGFPWNIRTV